MEMLGAGPERAYFCSLLVKLIGVNKGRHVTLKYFSIFIKVSRKQRVFCIDLVPISPCVDKDLDSVWYNFSYLKT